MKSSNVDKEKMMFSRRSATFFNKTLQCVQKRGYIEQMHEISNICYTIEDGKIREAKQLIAKFSKENGKTYHNMFNMVIDTATKCHQLDLAKEVKNTVLRFNEESKVEADSYYSNNF